MLDGFVACANEGGSAFVEDFLTEENCLKYCLEMYEDLIDVVGK